MNAFPKTIVILPTFCEAENIREVCTRLTDLHPNLRVFVMDSDSPDGTAEIVREISEKQPRIHLVELTRDDGIGDALLKGLHLALQEGAELIVTMDADLSHDPSALPGMIELAAQHDLVIGSRYINGGRIENWPFYRRWMSAGANALARFLLGLQLADCTSGYRVWRADLVRRMNRNAVVSSGYAIEEELLLLAARAGARMAEYPITFVDRQAGKSKVTPRKVARALFLLFGLRRVHGRARKE